MGKRTNKMKVTTGILADVYELVTVGLGGTTAVNTFPYDETTNTEASAAYCKTYDVSATEYQNVATSGTGSGYTANYQLWPDTEAENDAVYFGASSKFGVIYTNVAATNATYSGDNVAWEYYNGSSWATLTILYDQTDSDDQDGDRPFQEDGYTIFSAPADWAMTTVDSQSAYWIRARCTGTACTQIPLLDSHEHYTVGLDAGTAIPFAGDIGRGRFSWGTTGGSTADTKLILCNITAGTASAVKTLTKGKVSNKVADFSVTVDADDEIAFFCTQEDGSTEYADGYVELTVKRTDPTD